MKGALLVLAALATGLGLVNLHSAATGTSGTVGGAFGAQATHALVGALAFAVASRIPVARLREAAMPAWTAGVVLLVLTLSFGDVGGGARSWLSLGPVRLQPSELMKVLLPLALAATLSSRPPRVREVSRRYGSSVGRLVAHLLQWACVVGLVAVPTVLVARQPDLGAVGLLGLGALSVVALAGVSRWVWVGGALTALLATPLGWFLLEGYQRDRIRTFLDPTRDPTGDGFQMLQSFATVASGGWLGRGWHGGTQGRLGFLPEHTTDFILAVLAEEWGLVGALLALALPFAVVLLGLTVAERARTRFETLLAGGLALQLLWQVVVNAGGVLGLLPLTGVTLPFFSYGGSSLLTVWLSVGLLAALARPSRVVLPSPEVRPVRSHPSPAPLRTDRARGL